MNQKLLLVVLVGVVLTLTEAVPAPAVVTDPSGRRIITHTREDYLQSGSGSGSASGSGDDFDFDGEDPWTDDKDDDCDGGKTTEPAKVTKEPEVVPEPEGSGESEVTTKDHVTSQSEVTFQPEVSSKSEVTSKHEVTTAPLSTQESKTEKPVPFKCPAKFEDGVTHFPDPENCHYFYQCSGRPDGMYWRKACPRGLAFHKKFQVCVLPKMYGLC